MGCRHGHVTVRTRRQSGRQVGSPKRTLRYGQAHPRASFWSRPREQDSFPSWHRPGFSSPPIGHVTFLRGNKKSSLPPAPPPLRLLRQAYPTPTNVTAYPLPPPSPATSPPPPLPVGGSPIFCRWLGCFEGYGAVPFQDGREEVWWCTGVCEELVEDRLGIDRTLWYL